ncbi:oxygen-dependent coproporphyrinogen oxidase [bacterium SCSIO 12741]|nr:oxygen-dependent coproporphyrinogen oxidase [bacterium SCSIO 12741]
MPNKEEIAQWFQLLQDQICQGLEEEDGKAKFQEDLWERPGGGGGRTRVISHGNVLEKGGVNFSAVYGELPPNIQQALQVKQSQFYATGISIVIHPNHPLVPIIHMNTRYFEIEGETWWFGGGIDLTPHYIEREEAQFFHQGLKDCCDRFDASYYPKFKKWADDYFYIKHRKETRGIGGIFFDRLNEGLSKEELFQFVQEVGKTFLEVYRPLVAKNKDRAYSTIQQEWQRIRRGRYVEFNLVYDKGTKFGLDTDGRIESILMSLPEHAGWIYNHQTESGSPEAETLSLLKKGIDWA